MTNKLIAFIVIMGTALFLTSCFKQEGREGADVNPVEAVDSVEAGLDPLSNTNNPPYLSLVDGLHVTGETIDVDIETFRLRVRGEVEKPLELSFDEIRSLSTSRISMQLECPGFFLDEGFWTGVEVKDVLSLAGVKEAASSVRFICLDEYYSSELTLDRINEGEVLLAFEFNDELFPPYHGYPLRVAAQGETGSTWVKWLGEILVSK